MVEQTEFSTHMPISHARNSSMGIFDPTYNNSSIAESLPEQRVSRTNGNSMMGEYQAETFRVGSSGVS